MNWRTHAAVGANAIWLTSLFGQVDQQILVLLPAAIIGGLLPDIDAPSAKIHYAGGGVLGGFRGLFFGKYFRHRGIMHSILAVFVLSTALFIFSYNTYPLLSFVFGLSYLSHAVIDAFNYSGVGFLFPFRLRFYHLLPRMFRSQVNGPVDTILFLIGVFGVALFFLLHITVFFPSNANLSL